MAVVVIIGCTCFRDVFVGRTGRGLVDSGSLDLAGMALWCPRGRIDVVWIVMDRDGSWIGCEWAFY